MQLRPNFIGGNKMKIVVAEDDRITRKIIHKTLESWGHEVVMADDGAEGLRLLGENPDVHMLITDWMMPEMDGLELCRKVRESEDKRYIYIIILTALIRKESIIEGFEAGADDYVTKPFDRAELRVRISVGERIINLERELARRVAELEDSLSHIKSLEGLLPICSHCKKIRDDKGTVKGGGKWQSLEGYIGKHSDAQFTHSLCPECLEKYYGKVETE